VNPEAKAAGLVEWQLFTTLTFARDGLADKVKYSLLFAWLREVAKRSGVSFKRLKWLCRQEAGEITGRLHFHLLLGGLPPDYVTIANCFRLMVLWDHEPEKKAPNYEGKKLRVGMARVRKFSSDLDGVGYVLKGFKDNLLSGADIYEFSKFSLDTSSVTLSEALIYELQRRMGLPRWKRHAARHRRQ